MKIILAVAATGVMWFFSTGANHAWPLAWLAPLPLLCVIPDLPWRSAALAAFAASAVGALNLLIAYFRLPPILIAGAILMVAVPYAGIALAWRLMARSARPAAAVIGYGALQAAVEYLMSVVSPNGTFGSLAYSQAEVPVVIQVASLTGLAGVTFVLSVLPAALAVAWRRRTDPRAGTAALAGALAPILLAVVAGASRLAAPEATHSVSVGLAASDAGIRYFDETEPTRALAAIHTYAALAATLASRGAQIVVLPEKFVGVTPAYHHEARSILADVARSHRVTIVAGFNLLGTSPARNTAVVFDINGHVALEYDKQHMVPGLESGYRRGHEVGMIPGEAGVGVAICKDLDFASLGRAYGRARTGLMLVPAWDFEKDGWLHSRMAVVRGVEAGFAIARTAVQGHLTVADRNGRILAERRSNEASEVLVTATVPVAPGGTFYTRTGDWFAWLCAGVVVASMAAGRKRRPRAAVSPT